MVGIGIRLEGKFSMTFDRGVFWSGIWNVVLGLILITPPIIYWEALLRFAAVAILITYGFRYIGVLPTVLFAMSDLAWGIFYMTGLPRSTGRSHASLLLSRLDRTMR